MQDLSSRSFDRTGRKWLDRSTVRLPYPEGPANALLTEMLTQAPYKVPEKTKKAKGTRKSSRRQAQSDSPSDDSAAHSSPEDEEEEEDAPPPAGGDETRKAAPTVGAKGSKKGRTLLPDYSTTVAEGEDKWLLRANP